MFTSKLEMHYIHKRLFIAIAKESFRSTDQLSSSTSSLEDKIFSSMVSTPMTIENTGDNDNTLYVTGSIFEIKYKVVECVRFMRTLIHRLNNILSAVANYIFVTFFRPSN